MKKILVIISALVLVLSITACTNTIEKQTNTVTNQESVTTLPAEEPVNMGGLTDEEIKSIVYEHAQVKPEEVNHVLIERDFDDGREEIEVDFWTGKTEYSYTLDLSGNILEFEVERND